MKLYLNFLSGREGASDSDVTALEVTFGLSTEAAADIYCKWLDSLKGAKT